MSTRRSSLAVALLAALWLAAPAAADATEPQGPPNPFEPEPPAQPAPPEAAPAPEVPITTYRILYDARVVPSERAIHVRMVVGNGAHRLKWIRFSIDPDRYASFTGEGEIERGDDWLRWTPPSGGGALRYVFRIDHLRDERSYDSRCGDTWAIFRGDDLVPPARVRTDVGAHSRSRLRLRLPDGWSAATRFSRLTTGEYRIDNPETRFDRPTGWFALGDLGVVRETVAGVRVTIAGPAGQGVRRQDWLAMLRWTLPVLRDLMGERTPERLTLVGAGDPMWRGGLSGPGSLFLHASRPLITEDGTSPILHEIMHAATSLRAGDDGDWIVEGMAELYSLELMRRSGTIGDQRMESTLDKLRRKGTAAKKLRVKRVNSAGVARSVVVMQRLDREIRRRSEGRKSLDDVLRAVLDEDDAITTQRFTDLVRESTGLDLAPLIRELTRI